MVRPMTKSASALPDFQNLIRVHFFRSILWWSNLQLHTSLTPDSKWPTSRWSYLGKFSTWEAAVRARQCLKPDVRKLVSLHLCSHWPFWSLWYVISELCMQNCTCDLCMAIAFSSSQITMVIGQLQCYDLIRLNMQMNVLCRRVPCIRRGVRSNRLKFSKIFFGRLSAYVFSGNMPKNFPIENIWVRSDLRKSSVFHGFPCPYPQKKYRACVPTIVMPPTFPIWTVIPQTFQGGA